MSVSICTCCPNEAQDLVGYEDRPTRFDRIYPLCEDCYKAVEEGANTVSAQNELGPGATRKLSGLIRCLFRSGELDPLVEGCVPSYVHTLFGYWLISLSSKIQDVSVEELLLWAGNNRPEPVLEGLRKARQPTCIG